MSQSMQVPPVVIDPYLAAAIMPPNEMAVDPQYHNLRFTTPIGRLAYCHVSQPHAIPQKDPNTPKKLTFSATLLMAPGTTDHPIVADLYRAVCLVADTHWPAIDRVDPASGGIVKVPGSAMFQVPEGLGGYHYPLRTGDDAYMKEPAKFASWRGLYFINCSMQPKTKNGTDQRPICLDELGVVCDPGRFYPGCYARLNITVAPFDTMGNRGVTFFLNAIQFAKAGERMAMGFDAVSAAQKAFGTAGALPVHAPMDPPQGAGFQTGFGPNSATPGSIPPGFGGGGGFAPSPQQAGFAPAPQAQPAYPQPQAQPGYAPQQQQQQPIPVQQPWQPAPTGGRPPGV